MDAVLITYDLKAPGKDYSKLHEKIKNFGPCWHCLESVWIVKTTKTVVTVRDELKSVIDENDLLFVTSCNSWNWATAHLSDECNKWLKDL